MGRIRELEQRIRQLTLLQDAVRKINSTLDLDQLLHEIVVDVAEAFGCSRTCVLLKNEADEVEIIAANGFDRIRKGYRYRIGREGMVGHVAATGLSLYAPDVRLNEYYIDSEPSTLSEIAIPLISKGSIIGVFDAQSPQLSGFSTEQCDLLMALADGVATAIENARLFREERIQKERILREQDEARQIQTALLPGADPVLPGYTVEGICVQVRAVGGDWFDYVPLGDKCLGIVLGDVCGKGMAAALLMSATRSILRRNLQPGLGPAQVLTRLNSSILEDFPSERFVTLIYAILDAREHTVRFANAGHLPPLFVSSDGRSSLLGTENGMPLGISECQFDERVVELEVGAKMLLYTDGIVETTNPEGEDYGVDRLSAVLKKGDTRAKDVSEDVLRFCEGASLSDDATLVQIRRNAA